jgi:tryptophan synthase alpha subunit
MSSIAADGTVIGSALINLFDRHKENEQAEASGSILTVSLHEKRVSSQAA